GHARTLPVNLPCEDAVRLVNRSLASRYGLWPRAAGRHQGRDRASPQARLQLGRGLAVEADEARLPLVVELPEAAGAWRELSEDHAAVGVVQVDAHERQRDLPGGPLRLADQGVRGRGRLERVADGPRPHARNDGLPVGVVPPDHALAAPALADDALLQDQRDAPGEAEELVVLDVLVGAVGRQQQLLDLPFVPAAEAAVALVALPLDVGEAQELAVLEVAEARPLPHQREDAGAGAAVHRLQDEGVV